MEKNYSNNLGFNNMASDIVVGLDIGTTKVATIIGYLNNRGKIEILGHGKSASKGVEFGLIQNLLKAQESIKTSVQLASSHARIENIESVFAGIAARHIKTGNCKHYILRSDHNALITQDELDSMRRDVENIALPPGQQIIAIIPQKYVIEDSADGACHESLDPVGELGSKITGYYQVIMGNYQEIKKIHTCISNVNIETEELILEPIASGLSCLSEDEKQRGVALIDIGGGTTDLIIYNNGSPVFTKVIAIGGNIITSDIAKICSISRDTAEKLKIQHGTCIVSKSNQNNIITIPRQPAPIQISEHYLAQIINARVEDDIIATVKREIDNSGYANLVSNCGIVITGGGAQLKHLKELIQFKTGYNTRIGIPENGFEKNIPSDLKKSAYATALGLLKYGIETVNGPASTFEYDDTITSDTDNNNRHRDNSNDNTKRWGVFKKVWDYFRERMEQVS